jgi:hypothetical protein
MEIFIKFLSHEMGHVLAFIAFYVIFVLIDNRLINIHSFFGGLFTTVFMDLDHLIDYFLYKKDISMNIHEFLSSKYFTVSGRSFVLFHGWEFLLVPLLVYFISKNTKLKIIALGIFVGLLAHLVFDTWDNHLPFTFYFFTNRLVNRFML